ncbi:MAG TPA: PAS domain-containing sensor histidine kinase [Bacteroidales bacterium]|nr:PAS domain-containing sensor histidine kinase [Bacteroidales bacterium]
MRLNLKKTPVPAPLMIMIVAIPAAALLAAYMFLKNENANYQGQTTLPVITGLLLIVATGLLISVVLWDQWVRFYREKFINEPYRKETEEALSQSNSLLKSTLESTADGLLVVDIKGKIMLYNRKFADMWKIPDELLATGEDSKLLEFVKKQLLKPEEFLEQVKKLYTDPVAVTYDFIEFSDGRYFARYSQPQIANGVMSGRVWSFRDITESKMVEKELIAAKEKAEEGDRLKMAFLHNVSHEIRTPMNAIIGFSSLLDDKGISEDERHQYALIISQSSNQLLSIITDIVDIANVESGQVRPNIAQMDLNGTLNNLYTQFSYKKNNVELNMGLGLPDHQAIIMTDGTKVIQILSNLISNALKFTPEGRIDFGYALKGEFLEFYVKDTGIGIPSEHIEKIFDRFYQVDRESTRQYGGTGLGLSICKAYAGFLGGDIRAESREGKGTRFVFTIPYRKDEA